MVGYRTYIVSGLVAIFGALEMVNWSTVLSDPKAGAVAVGSAILMAIMRTLTSTPPGAAK